MLHTETVEPGTLSILNKLMKMQDDSMDIAAMKIQAILGRGKKKDFWDLYELLHHFTLSQIIEWHTLKFPSQRLLISIPNAITYFDDADNSDEPVSLKGQTWESVKEFIKKKSE